MMKVTIMLTWYSLMAPALTLTCCSLTQACLTLRSVLLALARPCWSASSKLLVEVALISATYMAVYRRQGSQLLTQHLIDGMGEVDGSRNGQPLPRFVSVADNRDFFYLLRRSPR